MQRILIMTAAIAFGSNLASAAPLPLAPGDGFAANDLTVLVSKKRKRAHLEDDDVYGSRTGSRSNSSNSSSNDSDSNDDGNERGEFGLG